MILRAGVIFCLTFATACAASPQAKVVGTGERYSLQNSQIEDYRLGVGDKIKLTVFNEPTLSGEFSVSASGLLSLPLVGDVDAVGKGPTEIATLIQASLGAGYIRDPKVNVEVITYRPFFILGEVKSPGQYPYASGLTVLNAIATAQGFTPRSKKSRVFIRRSGSALEEEFLLTPELRVWPGDTIRLGERYF